MGSSRDILAFVDPTHCHVDEHGIANCARCAGRVTETSRHPSHIEERDGKRMNIDRVWGQCEHCNSEGWWRAASIRDAH